MNVLEVKMYFFCENFIMNDVEDDDDVSLIWFIIFWMFYYEGLFMNVYMKWILCFSVVSWGVKVMMLNMGVFEIGYGVVCF